MWIRGKSVRSWCATGRRIDPFMVNPASGVTRKEGRKCFI